MAKNCTKVVASAGDGASLTKFGSVCLRLDIGLSAVVDGRRGVGLSMDVDIRA